MAKFYVESGPVQRIFSADTELEAALRAFQWTCDEQAKISAETPLEHIQLAEELGVQMHDVIHVNERGFGRRDGWRRPTIEVVDAWMDRGMPLI